MEQEEKYQVFSVDVCTQMYAIEYWLVGAKSIDDLTQHLQELFSYIDKHGKKHYYDQNRVKRIIKERENRIRPLVNVYTTNAPYTIIDSYAYAE